MLRLLSRTTKCTVLALLLVLLLIAVACGEDATATPVPTSPPAPAGVSAEDVASAVQAAVSGIQIPEGLSAGEISSLVEAAVKAQAQPGASPAEIDAMVKDAVAAAAAASEPGVSRDDLAAAIDQAVSDAVAMTLAKIPTPMVATPVAEPTEAMAMEDAKRVSVIPFHKHAPPGPLDPHKVQGGEGVGSSGALYANLVMYSPVGDTNEVISDLAESWKVSSDGRTYTFDLRRNAVFHDGVPITARDVAYSMDRIVAAGEPRPRAGLLRTYYETGNSEIVDNNTVNVTTKSSSAAFLGALAIDYMKIVPKHIFEPEIIDVSDPEETVGSGPWKFVRHKKGVSLEYERNEEYYIDGWPASEGFIQFIIQDAARSIAAFEAEQVVIPTISFIGQLSTPDWLAFRDRNVDLLDVPPTPFSLSRGFFINHDAKPLDDKNVRRAIFLALDRKAFVDAFTAGTGAQHGPMPSWCCLGMSDEDLSQQPGFRHTADGRKDPQDLEEARRLLAESGLGDGFDLVMTIGQGRPEAQASLVKEQLAEIGINMTIRALESAAGFVAWQNQDFEIGMIGTGFSFHDPDPVIDAFYLPTSLRAYSKYEDPRVVELFAKQASALDPADRAELVGELETVLLEGGSTYAGLYWEPFFWPTNKRLKGWSMPSTCCHTGDKFLAVWLAERE